MTTHATPHHARPDKPARAQPEPDFPAQPPPLRLTRPRPSSPPLSDEPSPSRPPLPRADRPAPSRPPRPRADCPAPSSPPPSPSRLAYLDLPSPRPRADWPTLTMPESVFAKYEAKAYPYQFSATLSIARIMGGIPSDPKVAEGWLRTKTTLNDDAIRSAIAEVMIERGIDLDAATEIVNLNMHLNGFKRDLDNGLYIEGRQVKAAIKEAANVRWPKEKWGLSRKGTRGFFAEHVFVQEDKIYLGVTEPTDVAQKFVHTWRGSGIQYEEYVDDVELSFTVTTDHKFPEEQWALLWLTGGQQGLGASRSQGYGRYTVIGWEPK